MATFDKYERVFAALHETDVFHRFIGISIFHALSTMVFQIRKIDLNIDLQCSTFHNEGSQSQ